MADEPTASLDSENPLRVVRLLRDARDREGATVVIATHDPRLREFATRLVELRDGRIVLDERRRQRGG